jgi:hypothetical protein
MTYLQGALAFMKKEQDRHSGLAGALVRSQNSTQHREGEKEVVLRSGRVVVSKNSVFKSESSYSTVQTSCSLVITSRLQSISVR